MPKSLHNKDGHVFVAHRRATFEYEGVERFEAGSELKSVRDGTCSLAEAFCQFQGDQLYLLPAHIAEYTLAHARNHPTIRARRLLLHRSELDRLHDAVQQQGLTLIPLSLYAKSGLIKLELALCRGKKLHDKRATIKEREEKREMDRARREHR